MPFESEKQRRWMHANKPEMAKRWERKEEALRQEGDSATTAAVRVAPIEITGTTGTPDWERAFLEFEAAELDPRRFPTPGILQRLETTVGEDWRQDYVDWKENPNRAKPLKPRPPGPLISEEDNEVKIKGSELKRIVAEELAKLHEATPDAFGSHGGPRGLQTDRVADAPEGETEWRETGFHAREIGPAGETIDYTDSSGRGGELARRGNVTVSDLADWSTARLNPFTVSGETTSGATVNTRTATGEEPTTAASRFGTSRASSYVDRGNKEGELYIPQTGYFGGDINDPANLRPRYAVQNYSQQTNYDQGAIQPGQQFEMPSGRPIVAPQAGTFTVGGRYELGQTGRARQRDMQRFQQGVDPAGNPMFESTQIKGSELKRIVAEELSRLMKEGGMMGHYMPNLVTAAGDTPEDIAREMLESGQEITEEAVTQAALDAGVLDDDLPDFIDAIMEIVADNPGGEQKHSLGAPDNPYEKYSVPVGNSAQLKQMVKETLLSEMGCGGGHHGHEHHPQHAMAMPSGVGLGGMQPGVPMIVIQTSEEEELPAETHPTRIYHKEQKPQLGIEDIIPMLLQLEGKVVQFRGRELEAYVKRSLKRVLREANSGRHSMGSDAGSIPASTGMGIMKREDDEDDKIEEGGKMGHYRRSPSGPDEEMYDLTKGERPPPHSTGDVTRKDPDANTEASMTPNYEVEIEQLVFDMLMSGMSEQEIMGMVEEYIQDASTYAK